ncbi:protein FAR-RED IMPAIRED RESPONSE 1-like [Bidens hawaiensis]|uniref:protein FAR-RED IMPAIRED RESPONSE 1-like n=1 Tax=Bidens hawaiensis TaxID=980011 RepID=UPI00404A6A38
MNLGPVKAFNLMRTQYGGFEKVENISSDYSFEYDVNDDRDLIRVFWANEISKSKYLAFGDIISFDATFKANKYKMVFVPFTAIDNHCHSVTVGAGLIDSKTIESYTWLLQMLLKSFSHAPKVVVTDQDPAMKKAIASVFSNTRHRLYMWHIMKKVADKVGADLCNNEYFKSRLCNIVWTDSISPLEFEEKGQIPAFYRDEPLSGLMHTTSRSESENHFFGKATNSQLTLVEFFNHFDFCMEIQRYNSRLCDHDSRFTYPQLETRSYLEREALRIYKRSIFNDLQDEMNEIFGGVSQLCSCEEEEGFLRCKIMDFNAYLPAFLEDVLKKDGEFGEESIATCSCKRFEQYGLFCHHIFYVMNMYQLKKFSKRYINDRWRKEDAVNIRTVPMSEFGNDQNKKIKDISREIKYAGEYLINSNVADIDKLIKVRDEMNLMIKRAYLTWYERVRPSKRDRFAAVLGFEQPSEVTVRVPTGIRNKGRGSHKIIKSKKKIAICRSVKGYRECQICHLSGHNSRTCKALQQQPQQ